MFRYFNLFFLKKIKKDTCHVLDYSIDQVDVIYRKSPWLSRVNVTQALSVEIVTKVWVQITSSTLMLQFPVPLIDAWHVATKWINGSD
jgi:hypothetical protein